MQLIFQNWNDERKQFASIFFANGDYPSFSGATAGNYGTVDFPPEEEFATGESSDSRLSHKQHFPEQRG
ncbi:MAG: hypothetical protein EZS28_013973 [Streblomastix strix]|uniref:Uncharacterized protein n=1 Tax=Streblomastix strix TaxID=222440 RepID=A0A5J4W6F7_9EUKA|nr:MAG: hypothetical protein EZS28_013973 [Streblomastix strix]